MAYQNVIFEQETGGITRITIKRPEMHNAPNLETRRELRDVLDRVAADAGVRVVVVTGAGEKSFVSGADVSQFQGRDPGEIAEYVRTLGQQLYNDFEDCAVPVIAAVNGYCFGGGLELAMSWQETDPSGPLMQILLEV